MNRECYNMCRTIVPVKFRKTENVENGTYLHLIFSDNDIPLNMLAGPYNDKATEISGMMRDYAQSRLIFVSGDVNAIEKTALALSGVPVSTDADYMEEDYFTDAEANADNYFVNISFKSERCMQELDACRKIGYKNILFTDCDMAKSEQEAIDLIMSSVGFDKVFVAMTKKQLNSELASKLIFENEFEKLEVPELDDRYYECLWVYLSETGTVVFDDDMSVKKLNRALHKKFGQMYSEEIISTAIDMAISAAEKDGRSFVREDDFKGVMECGKESVVSRLLGSIGRDNFKHVVKESIALGMEMQRNPKLDMRYENMVFSGNPGAGKTTAAEMYAQILSEEGLGNGKLVVAERKDLIGGYLGQTAPKIAECFNEAKGGVLFVDEAGFFLNGDDYTTEAVREFVRYMECCPDVSVIFALYPHELNEFLNLDAGLSSRIKRVVDFEDYSDEELVKIAGTMFKDQGYTLGDGTENAVKEYIKEQKNVNPDNFGNARSIRKLVDAAIVEISFRHIEDMEKKNEKAVDAQTANKAMLHNKGGKANQENDTEKNDTGKNLDMVLEEDIRKASKRLIPAKQTKSKMGFLA